MKELGDFLGRAPFVVVGVLGIFSFVGTFMTLEENIAQTLDAWRSITRPIWDFLLGWLFDWAGWKFPWYVKDYLTMALVTMGMRLRRDLHVVKISSQLKQKNGIERILHVLWTSRFIYLKFLLGWPKEWISSWKDLRAKIPVGNPFPPDSGIRASDEFKAHFVDLRTSSAKVFFETAICVLILIAINYVLIGAIGLPSVAPERPITFPISV